MKKYYEILDLEEGATQQDIKSAYKRLKKELDPANNDNLNFFIEETKKLEDAYGKLINVTILSSKKVDNNLNTENNNNSLNKNETKPFNNIKKKHAKRSRRYILLTIILFFILLVSGFVNYLQYRNTQTIKIKSRTRKIRPRKIRPRKKRV